IVRFGELSPLSLELSSVDRLRRSPARMRASTTIHAVPAMYRFLALSLVITPPVDGQILAVSCLCSRRWHRERRPLHVAQRNESWTAGWWAHRSGGIRDGPACRGRCHTAHPRLV